MCMRFSACSKATLASDSNTSSVTSRPFGMPNSSAICLPTMVSVSWNAGRQCMNLTCGLPVAFISVGVDLVGRQQLDPLVPHLLGLAHRDPDVGVDEVDALHRLGGSSVIVSRAPVFSARSLAIVDVLVGGQSCFGPQMPHVHAEQAADDHQRVAHVVAGVADEGVGDLA